jgi:hypothetical protein
LTSLAALLLPCVFCRGHYHRAMQTTDAHTRFPSPNTYTNALPPPSSSTSGAAPTAATYTPLFAALSDAAAAAQSDADGGAVCARAVHLYSLMLDQGVAPEGPLYTQVGPTAVHAWCPRRPPHPRWPFPPHSIPPQSHHATQIIAAFAACGAHATVLRLALTFLDRGWAWDTPTLGAALEAAVVQGAWDAVSPMLRRGAEGGARAPGEALQMLLVRCAGAQAWGAAEAIIQVGLFGAQTGGRLVGRLLLLGS